MAKVKLADGRTIQVPDGSTPEQVNEAVNQIHVKERAPYARMAGEQAQGAIERMGREDTTNPLTVKDSLGDNGIWGSIKRFVSNAATTLGAPPRASDYVTGPVHAVTHPIESAKLLAHSIDDAQAGEGYKANKSFNDGDYLGGAAHAVYGGLPIVGPMLSRAGEQFSSGDIAGGLGTTGGVASGVLTAPERPSPVEDLAKPGAPSGRTAALEAATLPVRGAKALAQRVRTTGLAPQAAENFANRAAGTTTADLDAGVNPGRTLVRTGMPVAMTKGSLLKKVNARSGELSKVLPPDHSMMGDLDMARQNISHDIHQSRVTSPIHMSDWETGAAVGIPVGALEGMAGGGAEGLTRGMEAAITGMVVKKMVESTPFRSAAARVLGPWGKETVGPEFEGYKGDAPQLTKGPTPMGPIPEPVPPQLEGNTVDTPALPSARGRKLSTVTPVTKQFQLKSADSSVPPLDTALGTADPAEATARKQWLNLEAQRRGVDLNKLVSPEGKWGFEITTTTGKRGETVPDMNVERAGWQQHVIENMEQHGQGVPPEVTREDSATSQSLRSALDAQAHDVNEIAVKRNFIRNKPPGAYQPKTLRLHDADGTPVLEVPLDPSESENIYGDQPDNAGHGGPGAMLRRGSKLLRQGGAKSGPSTGPTLKDQAEAIYRKMEADPNYEPTVHESHILDIDATQYENWENEMGRASRSGTKLPDLVRYPDDVVRQAKRLGVTPEQLWKEMQEHDEKVNNISPRVEAEREFRDTKSLLKKKVQ